ncbi:MAG: ATP-binding protein, partial [Vulcanisaeta sp.]|nr:ATP-binding protein [Vulcanisaeta sp.]
MCGNLGDFNRLIEEVRRVRVPLENMDITVRFRDREHEIRKFIINILKSRGVSLIFGPRGAGKSTLVKVLGDAIRVVGGFDNIAFVRYTFGEEMLRETRVNVPGLGIDTIQELEGAINISLSMDPISLGMNLVKPILILARAVRSYGLRDKRIVVVYDDIDRFLRKYGYEMLDAVANKIPDLIREHDVWVKALFMVSDQAAVNMAMRVSPKGGMKPYLLWNLPRSAFGEVVNEIAELTGTRDINTELLWNLLGGNVRELEILVNNYAWDVNAWLREVIRRVITAFEKYVGPGSFLSVNDALRWLIEKGRVAARDYGLGDF